MLKHFRIWPIDGFFWLQVDCINSLNFGSALRSSYNTEDVVAKISKQVRFDKAFEPRQVGNSKKSISGDFNLVQFMSFESYSNHSIQIIRSSDHPITKFCGRLRGLRGLRGLWLRSHLVRSLASLATTCHHVRPLHLWFPYLSTHGSWGSATSEFWLCPCNLTWIRFNSLI